MRLIQPYPDHCSPIKIPRETRVPCPLPVRFVRVRCKQHAAASGYDRVCDFIDAPTVRLPKWLYWLGETALRPYCLWQAHWGGSYEYSRYDCVMESAVIRDALRSQRAAYHFVYADKSFKRMASAPIPKSIKLVGTVHHPVEHQAWIFRDMAHFQAFDRIITMDRRSVSFWEGITQKANVKWIPHGVDTKYFFPSVDDRSHSQGFRIVFAGAHERDFKALSTVVDRLSRVGLFRFDLVGNSPEVRNLAQTVPRVYQHERLSDNDYRALFQASDLLFLPLKNSTVCNAVLEALACGVPVVTTHGGIEDYLDKSCSHVVPVGDSEAMFRAVHQLLARGEHARLAARARACRFSWIEVAKMHVALYEELLGSA
jgi:glycosyltransferase involved in cell wall biosynthesis